MKRLHSVALAVIASAAVAGCASIESVSTPYAGASRPPPTDAAHVEVLRSEPARAHERLGEIQVDASIKPTPPMADIEQRLRSKAAEMGADAVVVVVDREQRSTPAIGPWSRTLNNAMERRILGVAIRYRE